MQLVLLLLIQSEHEEHELTATGEDAAKQRGMAGQGTRNLSSHNT